MWLDYIKSDWKGQELFTVKIIKNSYIKPKDQVGLLDSFEILLSPQGVEKYFRVV